MNLAFNRFFKGSFWTSRHLRVHCEFNYGCTVWQNIKNYVYFVKIWRIICINKVLLKRISLGFYWQLERNYYLLSLLEVYICKENLKFGPIVHKLGMYLYYILWTFLWKDREFRDRFFISKVHENKSSFKNTPKKVKKNFNG